MIMTNLIVTYHYAGDLEQAATLLNELEATSNTADNPFMGVVLASLLSLEKLERGELDSLKTVPLELGQDFGALAPFIPALEWIFSANPKIHLARGEFAEALDDAQQTLGLLEMRKFRFPLAQVRLQIGLALQGLGKTGEAIDLLRGAATECREAGNVRTGWLILKTLSELETGAGNQAQANRDRQEAAEMVGYILDHIGDAYLKELFINKPAVRWLLDEPS